MVSAWWLLALFQIGGSAGVLVMALMRLSGSLPESSMRIAKHARVVLSDEY
jgi:hypothetical protein